MACLALADLRRCILRLLDFRCQHILQVLTIRLENRGSVLPTLGQFWPRPILLLMTKAFKPSPRIHLIVARDAPIAIVYRRGPSAWFHILRWWLEEDRLEPGVWIKEQIYPERCDVSPDGRYLLTFVSGGFFGKYDVVQIFSRAPWLSPLESWSEGDTWGRGWRFVNDRPINDPDLLKTVVVDSNRILIAHDQAVDTPVPKPARYMTDRELWIESGYPGTLLSATHNGFIKAYVLSSRGEISLIACHDLNHMSPDPQPAPEWATRRDLTQED